MKNEKSNWFCSVFFCHFVCKQGLIINDIKSEKFRQHILGLGVQGVQAEIASMKSSKAMFFKSVSIQHFDINKI